MKAASPESLARGLLVGLNQPPKILGPKRLPGNDGDSGSGNGVITAMADENFQGRSCVSKLSAQRKLFTQVLLTSRNISLRAR